MKLLNVTRHLLLGSLIVAGLALAGCDAATEALNAGMDAIGGVHSDVTSPPLGDATCTPSCVDKQCGDDGCGGVCGSCAANQTCTAAGQCEANACVPACDGKQCGDDGCGDTCGTCAADTHCNFATNQCDAGDCTPAIVAANCQNRACGDDGCGGVCGTCAADQTCTDGQCIGGTCTPDCDGKACGPDGCGGFCPSECVAGEVCNEATFTCDACVAQCDGRDCGNDGCGGSCGTCAAGESCDESGHCAADAPEGGSCLDWFGCANACPQGPNLQQCWIECDNALSATGLQTKNDLMNCQNTSCADCAQAADQNQCLNDCTMESCGDEYNACVGSAAQGTGDCLAFYTCLNGCPDRTTDPNGAADCQDACIRSTSQDGWNDAMTWESCALGFCPDFNNACVQAAATDEAQCKAQADACFGGGAGGNFCDEASGQCVDCASLVQCLNGCGNDTACAQACFGTVTEETYTTLWQPILDCISATCPDANDLACQNNAIANECAAQWQACTGQQQAEPCDPADHPEAADYCYDCAGIMTCTQGCGSDTACAQECANRGTAEAQGQLSALATCVLGECSDPNDAACQNAALSGTCAPQYNTCMGTAKSARPAVSMKALMGFSTRSRLLRPADRATRDLVSRVGVMALQSK